MTVSTVADRTPELRRHLLPTLDAATAAVREAHETARAVGDSLLACRHLPGEVFGYAPEVSGAAARLAGATRGVVAAVRVATADPSPESLRDLHRAMGEVGDAVVAARGAIEQLRTAAGWFGPQIHTAALRPALEPAAGSAAGPALKPAAGPALKPAAGPSSQPAPPPPLPPPPPAASRWFSGPPAS
ncbi:hypothetical protein GCM10009839_11020 [Catenulispora yoronensis]|uniref:Uncharacterized protein n=1 Tax=Catenulispora yoronensis TaxID=450799 RepID=A0ABN2TQY2_9ACTN